MNLNFMVPDESREAFNNDFLLGTKKQFDENKTAFMVAIGLTSTGKVDVTFPQPMSKESLLMLLDNLVLKVRLGDYLFYDGSEKN